MSFPVPVLPTECQEDLLSDACASVMQPLCSASTLQYWGDGSCYSNPLQPQCTTYGQPHSSLLDGRSACNVWYNALVNDLVTNPSPPSGSTTYPHQNAYDALDRCIDTYCSTETGTGSIECQCSLFPKQASKWCEWNAGTCSHFPSDQCAISEIVQTNSDGSVSMIEFSKCSPPVCWLEVCNGSPARSLVPMSQRAIQVQKQCPLMCMTESGGNSVQLPPVPIMPSNTVVIDEDLIKQCGDNGQDPGILADISADVTIAWTKPFVTMVTLANSGDYLVQWSVQSIDTPSVSLYPSSGVIGNRNTQTIAVSWNRNGQVTYTPDSTVSTVITLQYSDGVDTELKTATISLDLTITPESGVVVGQQFEFSIFPWLMLLCAVILAAICLWDIWTPQPPKNAFRETRIHSNQKT